MKDYMILILRNIIAGTYSTLQKYIVSEQYLFSVFFVRQFCLSIIMFFVVDKKEIYTEFRKLSKPLHIELFTISFINAIGSILIYISLLHIPISIFSILEQSMVVIISIIMGYFFLKERITFPILIGLFISLVGLFFVVSKGDLSLKGVSFIGLGILFIYSILMGITGVMSTKILIHIDSKTYTVMTNIYRFLVSVPLPFLFGENIQQFFKDFQWWQWIILIFVAIGVFLGDLLFAMVTKKIGYLMRQMFIFIIPCVSAFLGMILFDEWFTLIQYLGLLLVIFGLSVIFKYRI